MSKKVKSLTLSSLKRIQRLLKKGYDVCVDFYACVKGYGDTEYNIQVSSSDGVVYAWRCLLDRYDYDSNIYEEEHLKGVTLDDIVVDSMNEIYYSSRKW